MRSLPALVAITIVLQLCCAFAVEAQREPLRLGTTADAPPPRRTTYVKPVYPPQAKAQRKSATVPLDLELNQKGEVVTVTVLENIPPFTEPAVNAAKQWRYVPTILNGKPTAVVFKVLVEFKPDD